LNDFDLPFNKIASPMSGHMLLINQIAAEMRKTFISRGILTLNKIDEVVNFFVKQKCPIELMHCLNTYPMKEEDTNLLCIPMLRERYSCKVGYSGHEIWLLKVCMIAIALGAISIEQHIR